MIEIKALSKDNVKDLLHFFDHDAFKDHHEWKGCYCQFYHFLGTMEEWVHRTPHENRHSAKENIEHGFMKGYMAYQDGKVVGWCNVNEKKNYAGLAKQHVTPQDEELKIAALPCFIISPGHRRQGISRQLLEHVMTALVLQGYDYLEVSPNVAAESEAEMYHGAIAMYEQYGFESVASFEDFEVMRKNLKVKA